MTADGTPRDTFSPGDSITDAGRGYPWTKNVTGTWWRVGLDEPLTWDQVLAWHHAAVVDPDDETTEPFRPVLMVPGTPTPRTGEVTIALPEYLDGLADGREVTDQRGVVWTATSVASPTGRMWSSGGSALSSRGLLNGGPVILRPDAPQPATTNDAVERAAVLRKAYNDLTGDGWGPERVDEVLDRVWDAALAAAGAGAEVDREAHALVTDVLREFSGRRSYADVADLVVRSLAAAGLLATAERDAEMFAAGHAHAMERTVVDGETYRTEWLAEHDAQVLRAWGESLLDRYPEDVFVPPSRDAYDRVHRARGATGVSLDALSADAMRRAARLAIQDAARIAAGEEPA